MFTIPPETRPQFYEICKRFGVRRLELFGSAARGTDFDPQTSDLDFLVEFGMAPHLGPLEQYFDLAQALSALFGRPVDLIEAGAVRNPYIASGIASAKALVYAA